MTICGSLLMVVVDGEWQSDVCHHAQHRNTGLAVPGSQRLGRGSGSRPGSSKVLSGWQPSLAGSRPWAGLSPIQNDLGKSWWLSPSLRLFEMSVCEEWQRLPRG